MSESESTETRRQQRARETRAKLFEAATELITQQGYHATSVDRIAARAGVAKATFFVHFASKAEIIAALMHIQTDYARKAREAALPEGPLEAMRAMVETLGKQAARSRTLSRGVLAATLESEEIGGAASALFDEVLAEMTADAHAAEKAGLLAPGVEPDALASSLLASYFGALLTSSLKNDTDMNAVLASLVDGTLRSASRACEAEPRKSSRRTKTRT
ncbi:TetR/AcrR family transcriptional regulator [Pendulispora rubella]|uniref:TetR/AcrR family transcriptional regulator n=1 Tax=Pendulispora rubella TaxID=2741070 RepID=A0ABZ2KQL9_9BACT